ncbi:MAG: hypothetical protein HC822_19135 [Oscillochloris sp.]|nr:hypothetical protein [Oscillochloris sp.]
MEARQGRLGQADAPADHLLKDNIFRLGAAQVGIGQHNPLEDQVTGQQIRRG